MNASGESLTEPELSITEAIKFSFRAFKENFWFLLWVFVPVFAVPVALFFLAAIKCSYLIPLVVIYKGIAYVGYMNVLLMICDGEKPKTSDLLQHWRIVFKFFVVSILGLAALVVALILLIVPGLILFPLLQIFLFTVVDLESGPIQSVRQFLRMVKGRIAYVIGGWTLAVLVSEVGALVCFIPVIPFIILSVARIKDFPQPLFPWHLFGFVPAYVYTTLLLLASAHLYLQLTKRDAYLRARGGDGGS